MKDYELFTEHVSCCDDCGMEFCPKGMRLKEDVRKKAMREAVL